MTSLQPPTLQLLLDPELAVLYALCATLDVTRQALLAAHPALEHEDFGNERPIELKAAGWLADSVINHINGLEIALQRYRREVLRARARFLDDLPF